VFVRLSQCGLREGERARQIGDDALCEPLANKLLAKVKGFNEPIRCYKVVGLYNDLVREGQVIREEQEGFKFMLDLQKRDKQEAITTLEAILARLRS